MIIFILSGCIHYRYLPEERLKIDFNENFRKVCIAKGLSRAKNFSWQHCAGVIADKIISDFSAQK